MATRALIGCLKGDNTVEAIYLHFDGYPSYAGKILEEHYNTKERVQALLALGDLSEIAESPDCPEGHNYYKPVKGYCIAYGRDRGEEGTESKIYTSEADFLRVANKYCYDYAYLFKDGRWSVSQM